jgi:hypothetical protein
MITLKKSGEFLPGVTLSKLILSPLGQYLTLNLNKPDYQQADSSSNLFNLLQISVIHRVYN